MITRKLFESSRFTIIQEGLLIGIIGAAAKTIWPGFPIIELYGFTGPIVLGAYGMKTWGHAKEGENETARRISADAGCVDPVRIPPADISVVGSKGL